MSVADQRGRILVRVEEPSVDLYRTPREDLRLTLHSGLARVSTLLSLSISQLLETSQVAMCMPGVYSVYDSQDARFEFLRTFSAHCAYTQNDRRLYCGSDLEAVIAAASGPNMDLFKRCVISVSNSHSGSIGFVNGTLVAKSGVLGPALNDTGSGHDIALKAMELVCNRFDRGDAPSPLCKVVLNWLSNTSRDLSAWSMCSYDWNRRVESIASFDLDERMMLVQFVNWARREGLWRELLSGLAAAVMQAASGAQPDANAAEIVKGSVDAAVEHIRAAHSAIQRADSTQAECPILLWGGMYRYNLFYVDLVLHALGTCGFDKSNVTLCETDCDGSLAIAMSKSRDSIAHWPHGAMVTTMPSASSSEIGATV